MLTLIPIVPLLTIVLVAVGIAYVVTGSLIGYWVRVVAWLLLHRTGLHRIATCPPCNAWWGGLGVSLLAGLPWTQAAQAAFVSCLAAWVLQARFGMAADEKFEEIFARRQEPSDSLPTRTRE